MRFITSYSKTLFFFGLFSYFAVGNAQVKIGDLPEEIHSSSLLELESSDKVLVISRVTQEQMNAIQPLPGAIVFNTDTQCVHFFQVDTWINLCEALNLNYVARGIVNATPTIEITKRNDTLNFEVRPNSLTSKHIIDFSIASQDIQNNAITDEKLAPNSVGTEELQDNTITDSEINYDEVTLADFTNDAGYLKVNQLISSNNGNALEFGTDFGVFLNSELLTHFDGNWTNLTNVPATLDLDSTDDFDGTWNSLTGIPVNLDVDSTD
ncbi:hypothetical protein N9L94_01890, partial [Robiginitalea sp.]|nr:hypothetical protein [Robiginitalea sp.]